MAAFYSNTINRFLTENDSEVFSKLATEHLNDFSEVTKQQEKSWKKLTQCLRNCFNDFDKRNILDTDTALLLEYKIPRREKRIDCVIIHCDIIIVIEFKMSGQAGKIQLEDYCLDLRDFHRQSRDKKIYPILLAPSSKGSVPVVKEENPLVQPVLFSNEENLADIIEQVMLTAHEQKLKINHKVWDESIYSPTPTIIEAVKTLYKGHGVNEITTSHAAKEDIDRTSEAVVKAIINAQMNSEKIICFITGVPGAGKTLAGLNIAHLDQFQSNGGSLATFLSGNVPLINVLREALKRDVLKKYNNGELKQKEIEEKRISTFLEKAHTFIDTHYFQKKVPPENKVLIFDEAQRAWDKEHKTRKSEGVYNKSEPHILFEIMNRHKDWCAIIALIGGGQEINTGESGLEEWGRTIFRNFKHWRVYISPKLISTEAFSAHKPLFKKVPSNIKLTQDENLHLSVSKRSFNAEKLSDWVHAVLDLRPYEANEIFNKHLSRFPIFLTRNLLQAKTFLKTQCLGTRRIGLVASSGARRLRAHGIDVDISLDETHWFLNSSEDIRSSNFLELAGKDFKIQGLELNWTCVCWDADFYFQQNTWKYQAFGGTKWKDVKKLPKQEFIRNKYRVLMTRAREGMVILVPMPGDSDSTRLSTFYDETFNYLTQCGVKAFK